MKLFGYEIRKAATEKEISQVPYTGFSSLMSRRKPMLLSTVYRCVDLISDSVAVLPFKVYGIDSDGFKHEAKDNPIYWLLDEEPNDNMTRFTFFKTMVASQLLTGNAYAYIQRDKQGTPEQLIYIPSQMVDIVWVKDATGIERKRYKVSTFKELVEPWDMIHVLNFSYDGIIGVSTLTHAAQTIDIATSAEEHASGFFKSGGAITGALTVEGPRLDKKQKDQIYETWNSRTNPVTGHPNGIVILESNMKYQPISINPKDSQFLESREFNVVDICRFFSVSPVKAFDLSKSSYSTVEATQLQFLTDTVLAEITKIECEINKKLFRGLERGKLRAEFDTSVILRTDKAAQATYWRELFNMGAATPNEIRRINNLDRMEHGDDAFIQVNMQPLNMYDKQKVSD